MAAKNRSQDKPSSNSHANKYSRSLFFAILHECHQACTIMLRHTNKIARVSFSNDDSSSNGDYENDNEKIGGNLPVLHSDCIISAISNHMPSTLESWPPELFYKLFKYFDALELFHTFGNLNSNIDALVSAATLHLKMERTEDYRLCEKTSILATFQLSEIKSLHVAFDFSLKPEPLEWFLKSFPLKLFIQLPSLTLINRYSMAPALSKMLPLQIARLPHLEHLKMEVGGSDEEYSIPIINMIFDGKNGYGFQSLKRLDFKIDYYRRYFKSSPLIPKPTTIEHLTMSYMAFDEFMQMIPCLRQVKSVKIHSVRVEAGDALPSGLCLPNCSTFLMEHSCDMKTDQLRSLLRCLTKLKNLQFSADRDDFKPNNFEGILQQECPKLRKLRIQIYFNSKYIRNMDEYEHMFRTARWWTQRGARVGGSEIEYGADGCLDEVNVEFDVKDILITGLSSHYSCF